VKVAFDSRPGGGAPGPGGHAPGLGGHGIGHYARCLLRALRETAGERDEVLETHRPRGAEVFHAPWVEGAMLHSPCPMVVTIHDCGALTRRSERLRGGGVHLRLRHLALQRATHVIVPTEIVAREAVAELGLERERVVVIPPPRDAPTDAAGIGIAAPPLPAHATPPTTPPTWPAWTWEDAGRETWRVYEDALARPTRPCVSGFGRRRAERAARRSPLQ
jgi:hypothetical protein